MNRLILSILLLILSCGVQAQTAVTYVTSNDILINPERGFYAHHQSTNAATMLNKDKLIELRENEGISLILMLYYLPDFMDGHISETALGNMETNFNTMREAGVKCVLRFAYRWNQNTTPYDPTVEIVEQHIQDITPVLRGGSDVIAVVQTGFIGVWGEWYYSTNFGFPTPNYSLRNRVVDGLLNALPERRMIQLRTPNLKYGICDIDYQTPITPDVAYKGSKNARIGHHNDCFLASSNDYGTYANLTNDKDFLEEETKYLAMGGETCNPSTYSECANAIVQMERFHWSYLNSGYHQTVLNNWQINGCMDEVKRRLGYRFVMLEGSFTSSATPGSCFSLRLKIKNEGFAAPFNPRDVEIILQSADNSKNYWVRLPRNPQFWLPGETIDIQHEINLPSNIPTGEYKLFLNLPDPEPELFDRVEYSIQLANADTWNAESGYNDLKATLDIQAGTGDNCDNDLSFIAFPRIPHFDRITSNHEYNISSLAKLYPNPLEKGHNLQLEFNADYHDQASLEIMSLSGQCLWKEQIEVKAGPNHLSVASSDLPYGLYIVSISGTRSYLRKKLAVQ